MKILFNSSSFDLSWLKRSNDSWDQLYKDGLAFAGGDWNASNYQTFIPNQDNIILLTDRQYFEDNRDIIVRLKEFLSKTFDPDHLSDNMNFIAQTLYNE